MRPGWEDGRCDQAGGPRREPGWCGGPALAAYVVAVLQRTSLGVAGIDATSRFDASASLLATFAVLQLLVYAGLQIPVGVSIDRLGPRRLIATGAAVMAAGQVLLALSHSLSLAIAGPGAGRGRRRHDLRQRAPAGQHVVPAAAGAGDHAS